MLKERGAFNLRKVIDCAMQILAGLIGAHRAGLVHRDIKPGNILRSHSGMYKLADFGLAQGSDLPEDVTQSDMMVGTLRFVAPEVALGEMATPASDLFSFGVTFFELVSGQRARREKQLVSLLKEAATEPIRDLGGCLPDLNESLCEWWRTLTAFDPTNRFVDAQQAYEALVKVADGILEGEFDVVRPHRETDIDKDASTCATQAVYRAAVPVSTITHGLHVAGGRAGTTQSTLTQPSEATSTAPPALPS